VLLEGLMACIFTAFTLTLPLSSTLPWSSDSSSHFWSGLSHAQQVTLSRKLGSSPSRLAPATLSITTTPAVNHLLSAAIAHYLASSFVAELASVDILSFS
jgi:hypothetical protein